MFNTKALSLSIVSLTLLACGGSTQSTDSGTDDASSIEDAVSDASQEPDVAIDAAAPSVCELTYPDGSVQDMECSNQHDWIWSDPAQEADARLMHPCKLGCPVNADCFWGSVSGMCL